MLAMAVVAILGRAEEQRILRAATVPDLPLVFARRKVRCNPGLAIPVKEFRIDFNPAGLRVKAADNFGAIMMGERVLLLTSVDCTLGPGRGLPQVLDSQPERLQHVVPAGFHASVKELVGHTEAAG